MNSYTDSDTNVSYFYNEEGKNYEKCAINCKNCKLKSDHCVICNYKEEYFHLENKKETCLDVCPDFYFRNYLKKECSKCHISCKNCNDNSPKCSVIFFIFYLKNLWLLSLNFIAFLYFPYFYNYFNLLFTLFYYVNKLNFLRYVRQIIILNRTSWQAAIKLFPTKHMYSTKKN